MSERPGGAHIGGEQDSLFCLCRSTSSGLIERGASTRIVLGGAVAKALATINSCSHDLSDFSNDRGGGGAIIALKALLCELKHCVSVFLMVCIALHIVDALGQQQQKISACFSDPTSYRQRIFFTIPAKNFLR